MEKFEERSRIKQIRNRILQTLDMQILNAQSKEKKDLVKLRKLFGSLLEEIVRKASKGIIRPEVFLRTSEKFPRIRISRSERSREINLGVLATAANPLQWGHVLMCLEAINQQNLDTVIILPQGDISYKKTEPGNLVPKELRHEMVLEVVKLFFPLIRYSDIGFNNGRRGQENIHVLLALNLKQIINLNYIVGVESLEKAHWSFDTLSKYAHRSGLGLNHHLTWLFHFRNSSLMKMFTLEQFMAKISLTKRSKISIKNYGVPNIISGGTSSTRYRSGERYIAPPIVDEYARENALYGYPRTGITEARKAIREARRLKIWGDRDRAKQYEEECFRLMQEEILRITRRNSGFLKPHRLKKIKVIVRAPGRIDISSGLGSDIFPVYFEMGGRALNAAITLNGFNPVRVSVKPILEPEIRIFSEDLNRKEIIKDMKNFANDMDGPLRLYKIAIIESGIIPESLDGDLKEILHSLGGGFEIRGRVDIPLGGGLGGSSILAAALTKALFAVTGRNLNMDEMIRINLRIEWKVKSYGGWQDSIGGFVGGIKLIRTNPRESIPNFDVLNFPENLLRELKSRIVLFYSGNQKSTGNLLRPVIIKYLLRDKPAYSAILEGREIGDRLYESLKIGDIDEFGNLMGLYQKAWNTRNGKEFSNKSMERLISEIKDFISGGKVSGTGGFFILVAKKGRTGELKRRLERISKVVGGKVYDWDFDFGGITLEKYTI
jgi:galactokinase/mevalonate kinase-like predicted kinase